MPSDGGRSKREKCQPGDVRAFSLTPHCHELPRPTPALEMTRRRQSFFFAAADAKEIHKPSLRQFVNSSQTKKSGVKPNDVAVSLAKIVSSEPVLRFLMARR
jgi:hypothetical protein